MATITEDYVSFETAKLLKEKGFNEECRAAYTNYGKLFTTQIQQYITNILCSKGILWDCTAPTFQMAMKWLLEVYNINIDIVSIWNKVRWEYQIIIITPQTAAKPYIHKTIYIKREQAAEAAIKYCLENLI